MTEHDKLKTICDTIGVNQMMSLMKRKVLVRNVNEYDAREIIFTQEFMDKLIPALKEKVSGNVFEGPISMLIAENLDNPVDYLYNLLELGNTNTKDTETLIQKN